MFSEILLTKCCDDAGKSDVKSSNWILFIYIISSQLCLESGSMFILWHTTIQDILVHLSFNLFYNSVSLHFCPIWQLASMLSMFLFSSNSISFSFRWSFCRIFPSVLNSTFKKKENPYSWNWKGGHTISNNLSIIATNDVNKVEVGRCVVRGSVSVRSNLARHYIPAPPGSCCWLLVLTPRPRGGLHPANGYNFIWWCNLWALILDRERIRGH